jgi:predicted transcriptional regulator
MNEKEISFLEEQVLFIASSVFALERFKVLEDGNSVIDSDNNFIFELFPNGMRKI